MELTELQEVVSELKKLAEETQASTQKLDSSKVLDFISFYGQVGEQQ